MSDNFVTNVPTTTGDTFAADDISGVKYTRVKVVLGADGINGGDVSAANPVPTQLVATSIYDGSTPCTIKKASGVASLNGDNTIITNVAAKKFRILALALIATSGTAVSAYLYNGASNYILGSLAYKLTLDMDGGGGVRQIILPFNQGGWFETNAVNESLKLNLSAGTPVAWAVTYIEVA